MAEKLRVLLISHTCQSRTEGQPKAQQLGSFKDLNLCVLTPDRWLHYGAWRAPDQPVSPSFRFECGKVAWPWLGPAQYYLHWYPKLSRLLGEFQPHIIDLWEEPWGLVSAQACRLRNRNLPKARVISQTEQNINKKLPIPFQSFRAYTLQNADFAIGRNQESVGVIRANGYRGEARVVPNAVDQTLFRPMDRLECQQQAGLSGFVVGYFGRIVEEKGIWDIAKALVKCPQAVNLLVVGSGPFLPELQRRIAQHDLTSRVHFVPSRPLDDLPRLMNAANCIAVPSHTTPRWKEQFGRVIIEANACGIPVIGSDSGAIPEVIADGGIVVPEQNSDALADAITRLANDPALCAEMGQAGLKQVLDKYTWQAVAGQMHGIYQHVAGMS